MPRTALTAIAMPTEYATAPSTITWTALDVANGNNVVFTGRQILLIRNVDAGGAHSVTVASVALNGRTGDAVKSVPASGFVVFQLFPTAGWQQTDGKLNITGDSASLEAAVLTLP